MASTKCAYAASVAMRCICSLLIIASLIPVAAYAYSKDLYISEISICLMGESEIRTSVQITDGTQTPQLVVFDAIDSDGNPVATEQLPRVEWSSSDKSVVTVDSDGTLHSALGPGQTGTATITATVPDNPPEAEPLLGNTIEVDVSMPAVDPYVTDVTILDEDGNPVIPASDGTGVKIENVGDFYQLSAAITWTNPADGSTYVEYSNGAAYAGLSFESDVPGTIYVNADTGRLNAQETGLSRVTATIGTCSYSIYVFGGTPDEHGQGAYDPVDSLTLRVVYENYPDTTVQEHTYSISDLEALGTFESDYTYFFTGYFYTCHADGVLLYDVIKLEGVSIDDVSSFTFHSDVGGYNEQISYDYLYNSAHYYFPNASLAIGDSSGAYAVDAVVVSPMLAITENSLLNEEAYDGGPMDPQVCLRLEYGTTGKDDTGRQKSGYNINMITIVLKGSPPVDDGGGKTTTQGSTTGSSTNNGSGTGNGSGSGTGNGTGSGSGGTAGSGSGGSIGSGGTTVDGPGGNGYSEGTGDGTGGGDGSGSGGRWQVYEMMKKTDSDVADLPYNNPLEPYTAPLAAGAVTAGGLSMGFGFKRRLL